MKTIYLADNRPGVLHFLFFFLVAVCFSIHEVRAQTPPFINSNLSTYISGYPFNSDYNKVQYLYDAGQFSVPGKGHITRLWVKTANTGSRLLYNLTIKIGHTNLTALTSTSWVTANMQTCLTAATYNLTTTFGTWYAFDLSRPFEYDPFQKLVVEFSMTSNAGFLQFEFSPDLIVRRTYGITGNPQPSATNSLQCITGLSVIPLSNNDIGVAAIDSPTTFCGGVQPVLARIRNYGKNRVASATINWSVNGIIQTPYFYTGMLDSVGGAAAKETQVLLGTVTFPTGILTRVKAWTTLPNGIADTISVNDTVDVYKIPSLNGSFTINPALSGVGNFKSINAAVAAMQTGGICGPVVFNVAHGTYAGQVKIPDLPGASVSNTITFKGANVNACILNYEYIAGTNDRAVVNIRCPFVTFSNFTINATGQLHGVGISIIKGADNCKVKNNIINMPVRSSNSFLGIVVSGDGGYNADVKIDHIEIDSNIISNGFYGIYYQGTSSNPSFNFRARGNRVLNYYGEGITMTAIGGIDIQNNYIKGNPNVHTIAGIRANLLTMDSNTSNVINANTIVKLGIFGIVLSNSGNTAANKGRITNNMIGGTSTYPAQNNIYLSNCFYWSVTHNSLFYDVISCNNADGPLRVIGGGSIAVMNNIFSATKSGVAVPFYIQLSTCLDSMDYNIVYRKDTSNSQFVFFNGVFENTASYKGVSGFNTNSKFVDVAFVNDTDLHTRNGCLQALSLSYAMVDIDGDTRSVVRPVAGADYIPALSNDIGVVALLQPLTPLATGTHNLVVVVKNYGINTATSFSVSYSNNGSAPITLIYTGAGIAPCDTAIIIFTGSNSIVVTGTHNIVIYTASPNANSDANKLNDTLRTLLVTPLNGVYTVGGVSANFADVNSAVKILKAAGVSGPVTFMINPGTYEGQVKIEWPVYGISATNTVTFDGSNAANRFISANANGTATIVIEQLNYVRLRNLTIINNGTVQSGGVAIVGNIYTPNNGTGCHVKKCNIILSNPKDSRIFGISVSANAGVVGNNLPAGADSVLLDSNAITGAGMGIFFAGMSNSSGNKNVKIRANVINSSNMGITILQIFNALDILNNQIILSGYNGYGMDLTGNNNTTSVSSNLSGNTILNATWYGVRISNAGGVSGAPFRISNNIIVTSNGNSSAALTINAQSTNYIQVFHNTLVYRGIGNDLSYCPFFLTGSSNVMIKNNIFQVDEGAGYSVAIYLATNPTAGYLNNNAYYNKSNTGLVYRAGTTYTTANYKSILAGGDSSINVLPVYVNEWAGDYHIRSACFARGTNLNVWVPLDIDGQVRANRGQIGADEANTGAVDISVDTILAPLYPVLAGLQNLRIRVRNNGTTTVTSFTLAYRLNNGTIYTQTWNGTLLPCDTTSLIFTGAQQVNISHSINNINMFAYNPNGAPDGNNSNDSLSLPVYPAMSGNYIIGQDTSDFLTFNEAVNALRIRGISGAVNFLVRTGFYNEPIYVNSIKGSSAARPITFRSMANHRDSVQISWNSSSDITYVLRLNCSYINFKNMSLSQLSHGDYSVIKLNTVTADTIENCKLSYVNSLTYGTILDASSGPTTGLVLRNNLLTGFSYRGLNISGATTAPHVNTVVDGNTFVDVGETYVYNLNNIDGLRFTNNIIYPGLGINSNTCYLAHAGNNNGFVFTGNRINLSRDLINFSPGYFSVNTITNRGLIANNVINYSSNAVAGTTYLAYYSNYLSILNNTIHASMPNGFTNINYICTDLEFKNNVISSNGGGVAMHWYTAPASTKIDYNNYYTNSISAVLSKNSNSVNYPDIVSWKASLSGGADKNSISFHPGYTNPDNLMPDVANSNSWSLNGRAVHDPRIATDINGTARPASVAAGVPDLGAFEFTPTVAPPNCVAAPVNPVAGGSQVFTFGMDTVARITYPASVALPASISVKQYTGTKPPSLITGTNTANYYIDVTAPAASYYFTMKLYYKTPWIGTVPTESALRLVTKTTSASWASFTGTTSVPNLVNKTITSNPAIPFGLPALYTGTDQNNPLPVTLISFKGYVNDEDVVLNWATVTETNCDYFTVERSVNGREFTSFTPVKAKGNSHILQNYSYIDEKAISKGTSLIYYRLKITDSDGSTRYSELIEVKVHERPATSIKVYPNPFIDGMYIEFNTIEATPIEVRDLYGMVVHRQTLAANELLHEIHLPANISKGMYFVMGLSGYGTVKIVKE